MSLQYQFKAEDLILEERVSRKNVDSIKKWLQNVDEKVVPKDLPNEMIVLFLISCHNDFNVTKDTISSFFKLKKDSPMLYDNRNVYSEKMELLMDMWQITALPIRTKKNYAIQIFKLIDNDYRKFDTLSILRVTIMLVDISLDKKNPPDGLIVIIDMEAAGMMHLTNVQLDICKKYFSFLQEAVPIKLTAIHYVNSSFVVNKLFSLLRSFIKSTVFDKIYFHPSNSDMEMFYEYVPRECLPKDFGGDLASLESLHQNTRQQFLDKQEFWDIEEQLRKKCH